MLLLVFFGIFKSIQFNENIWQLILNHSLNKGIPSVILLSMSFKTARVRLAQRFLAYGIRT